jgi:TPR repeat protein
MHREGHFVARNDAEALRWFQFAADHASGAGCLNLSEMYFQGRGVAKDESRALAILRRGAMLGDPFSQAELARRLQAGDGVRGDSVEACAWYDLSARGGNESAKVGHDSICRSLSAAQMSAASARAASFAAEIKAAEAARNNPP